MPYRLQLIFLILLDSVTSFNFDLHFPIVIHDAFDKNESHFGASLTLVDSKAGPGWVVIGAPKADSSLANYSGIREPGVLWKCALGGLDRENRCSLLQVDAIGEVDVKLGKAPAELIHRDRKDNGMLGAAMTLGDSDRFVTCSSRWVNQKYKYHHLMNGLCYWISKEELLRNDSTVPDFSHRLSPLLSRNRQAYTLPKVGGSSDPRFDWAFGQAGFSIHMTRQNELIMGAPGILEWAGSVIEYRDAMTVSNKAHRRFNIKPNDPTFAKVLIARAQAQVSKKLINYFEYFGYAVTSGTFLQRKSNLTQYAAGAPRASSLSGKVLVFTFGEDEGGESEGLHFLVDPLEGSSAHFASYFGSVLGALDVTGDGLDELLVGAPLYEATDTTLRYSTQSFGEAVNLTRDDEEDSGPEFSSGDEGCVFVYFSLGDDFGREPQELCGDNRPGSRFGSAICPLGDINHDGFQDVAIGAPYEAEGRGAVYIYIGSPKRLILSQKISPEDISLSIRGFGYALSGSKDIDENAYPDLAVGAYISNHVIIYRGLPVVNITGNMSSPVGKLTSSTGTFSITSCLSFNGVRIPEVLEFWLKLSADTEIRKSRIVEFLADDRVTGEQYTKGTLLFRGQYHDTGTCYTFQVTTVGDLDSVTLPVTVRQEYWLITDDKIGPKPLHYEIRKTEAGTPVTHSPETNPKFSDLSSRLPLQSPVTKGVGTLSIPIAAICQEDGDPVCLADLSLSAGFRTPEGDTYDGNKTFVIGSSKVLILQVELRNRRERANLPLTVDIAWNSPPVVRNSRSDCKRVSGEAGLEQLYSCSLPNPLSKNKKETVEIELDMTGIYADSSESSLSFQLSANTSSALVAESSLGLRLPLSRRAHVLLMGQVGEASFFANLTAETVNFTHIFEVGMMGQSPITGVRIRVAIPTSLRIADKVVPFLRIREPLTTYEGSKMSCLPVNGTFYLDPSQVSYEDQEDIRRVRRDLGKRSRKSGKGAGAQVRKPLRISCQTPGVECMEVECEAHFFRPTYRALVEFRLRLITETARILFSEQERETIVIESLGRVAMLGADEGHEVLAVSQTLVRAESPSEVKAWILIVATGGGLVLLTLITVTLTECGFFRRRKLEELQALMAQQEVNEHFDLDGLEEDEEYYDYAPMARDEMLHQYGYPVEVMGYQDEEYEDGIYDELD